MRVLYLQPAASFGGAERQATYVIEKLPHHGVEVLPIVGPGHEIAQLLAGRGIDFLFDADLPADEKAPRSLGRRAALYGAYVRAFFRLLRHLERHPAVQDCHLVYAARPFAWVLGTWLGRRLGIPVVWRAGTQFEHWLQPAVLGAFARRRAPKAVVYTSEAVRRALAPRIPAPGFVLHNGVDMTRFSSAVSTADLRTELGIPPDAPVIALVARIAPEKGLDLLLAVAGLLRARLPGVRLLVAGDSGWRDDFARACRLAGLDDAVHLLGFVGQVERVYATADIVVSTSLAEGCPNAVLEAMAMGRPVVATRVGGTAEVLCHERDGVLVPPADAQALAQAVVSLWSSPASRANMGRRAAARVAADFSADHQVEELALILRWASQDHVEAHQRRRVLGRLLRLVSDQEAA